MSDFFGGEKLNATLGGAAVVSIFLGGEKLNATLGGAGFGVSRGAISSAIVVGAATNPLL